MAIPTPDQFITVIYLPCCSGVALWLPAEVQ
jgi:hypothetical protein